MRQTVRTPHQRSGSDKHSSLHSVQPYDKAPYNYASKTPGDLGFKLDNSIIALEEGVDNHGWCFLLIFTNLCVESLCQKIKHCTP